MNRSTAAFFVVLGGFAMLGAMVGSLGGCDQVSAWAMFWIGALSLSIAAAAAADGWR